MDFTASDVNSYKNRTGESWECNCFECYSPKKSI